MILVGQISMLFHNKMFNHITTLTMNSQEPIYIHYDLFYIRLKIIVKD